MKTSDLLKRIDELLIEGNQVLQTSRKNEFGAWVDSGLFRGFRTGALSFIERVYGNMHPHYTEFFKHADNARPHDTEQGIAILKTIQTEVNGGWHYVERINNCRNIRRFHRNGFSFIGKWI